MKRSTIAYPSGEDEEHASGKRPRKQRMSRPSRECPLLRLPLEVRRLVLKELLSWPEPIDFQSRLPSAKYATRNPLSDPKLHLNVLRTNRQLYEEGSAVLYNNTIKWRAWSKWPIHEPQAAPQTFPYILSPRYGVGKVRLPEAILGKITKIHIEVTAGSSNAKDPDRLRSQLREIASVMKETLAWKHITVAVDAGKIDSVMLGGMLNPFLYIRGCEFAHVTGVPEFRAKTFASLMTSNDSVIDLDKMYEACATYASSTLDGNGFKNALAKEIRHLYSKQLSVARDNDDVSEFRKQRTRLTTLVSAYIMRQQELAFAHDPCQWPTETRLVMKKGDGSGVTEKMSCIHREVSDMLADSVTDYG